ncbi:MAG: hypothetical protein CVV13_03740 [Gammaproteobacteria bacterium HGW-Gammaproteobacteria-3]|nr:MAG: hypothetical protein CVV13_03740 [Gammaproteobacteria bacterium HGW-Gammaproteobacteria-3]
MSHKGAVFRIVWLAMALSLNACQTAPTRQSQAGSDATLRHRFALEKNQSLIGGAAEIEIEGQDSLAVIGRAFGLGFDEISRANSGLDPWIPEPGRIARLPLQFILPDAPHKGIVLNLAAKRLFYYPKAASGSVLTYPVGIGRQGWETPLGRTRIAAKKAHPSWTVPASVRREHAKKGDPLPRIVAAGPNNPLGDYALRLDIAGYLIHGTNKPYGVGMEVSHGCIRLYPEDIARLYQQTPVGTQVLLVNQPYLTAWKDDQLYLQAYRSTHKNTKQRQRVLRDFLLRLKRIERKNKQAVDWGRVKTTLARADGIPTAILMNRFAQIVPPRVVHPPQLFDEVVPEDLTADSWKLWVQNFPDEKQALRLSAMLNHQGPPIPAHTLDLDDTFTVVAGPFKGEDEAKSAARRIRLDFSLTPRLIEPGQTFDDNKSAKGLLAHFRALFE